MSDKYSTIHHDMVTKGYHVGTFADFFDDITGITSADFDCHSKTFIESSNYTDTGYVYRHNYIAQHSKSYLYQPMYTGPIPTAEDELDEVPMPLVQKRKDFINKLIEAEPTIRTTQQWGRLELSAFDGRDEDFRKRVREMEEFFRTFFTKFSAGVYPILNPLTASAAYQYSLYEDGDFSEVHYDGVNPSRVCVIIMYFSDPATYDDSCGGELYIETTDGNVVEVKPLHGTYAMLDFTKFNLGHGIKTVKNNFKRYALQCFIGI